MAGGRIRLLARRLKQAILVCLVGCVIAFYCYSHLWEMISDRTAQNIPVCNPPITVEGIFIAHLAVEIDNKCTQSKADNLGWSYRPVFSSLVVSASWPEFRHRSSINPAMHHQSSEVQRDSKWIYQGYTSVPACVPELISGRHATVFYCYPGLRAINTGYVTDSDIADNT
jgi:hypothetical protein